MAELTLPKLGGVKGPTWMVFGTVVLLVVGALIGLSIWTGSDDPAPTPPPAVEDEVTYEEWLQGEVNWCDSFYETDPPYCEEIYVEAFG